jgi:hypothetical protein
MVASGLGTWVRMHDVWVIWEGHGIIGMLLTGHMVRVCHVRTWLGGNILAQGLTGLIEYLYHQSIPSFLEA